MKKINRRILIDTNIWSYVATNNAIEAVTQAATASGAEIAVAPTVAEEIRRISDDVSRRKTLKIIARPNWIRLMPEAYSECSEIKAEIKRLRPEWIISNPKHTEVNRLRYEWIRRSGGYWGRLGSDVPCATTDESLQSDNEIVLAREEATATLLSPELNSAVPYAEWLENIGCRTLGKLRRTSETLWPNWVSVS